MNYFEMAKGICYDRCKDCGAYIPKGQDYCPDCQQFHCKRCGCKLTEPEIELDADLCIDCEMALDEAFPTSPDKEDVL